MEKRVIKKDLSGQSLTDTEPLRLGGGLVLWGACWRGTSCFQRGAVDVDLGTRGWHSKQERGYEWGQSSLLSTPNLSLSHSSWINNPTKTSWEKQPSQKVRNHPTSLTAQPRPTNPYLLGSYSLMSPRPRRNFLFIPLSGTFAVNTFWQGILTITLKRKTVPWKECDFGARQPWALLPALPLNGCVSLGAPFNLFDCFLVCKTNNPRMIIVMPRNGFERWDPIHGSTPARHRVDRFDIVGRFHWRPTFLLINGRAYMKTLKLQKSFGICST